MSNWGKNSQFLCECFNTISTSLPHYHLPFTIKQYYPTNLSAIFETGLNMSCLHPQHVSFQVWILVNLMRFAKNQFSAFGGRFLQTNAKINVALLIRWQHRFNKKYYYADIHPQVFYSSEDFIVKVPVTD